LARHIRCSGSQCAESVQLQVRFFQLLAATIATNMVYRGGRVFQKYNYCRMFLLTRPSCILCSLPCIITTLVLLLWELAGYSLFRAIRREFWSIRITPQVASSREVRVGQSTGEGVHAGESISPLALNQTSLLDPASRAVVFYHILQDNGNLVRRIWREQMKTIRTLGSNVSNVFYTTVGGEADRSYGCQFCHMARHWQHGSENYTLQLLYDHCSTRPSETVAYIHTTGSLHPSAENDAMRRFATLGALSEPCLNLPPSCNICATRFSAAPHHHVPGNMWVARCSYIRRLIPPLVFAVAVDQVEKSFSEIDLASCSPFCRRESGRGLDWKIGSGRYAAEHWVASHPAARPCDVYAGAYVTGYDLIPRGKWTPKLSSAPRLPLSFHTGGNITSGIWSLRLMVWNKLYNSSPEGDHWANMYNGFG